jgi:hypothetical protein
MLLSYSMLFLLPFVIIFYRGRFSLRGSELGWTKSWFMNLGLGEESTAKIKLRMGLNLKSYKVDICTLWFYRLLFRAPSSLFPFLSFCVCILVIIIIILFSTLLFLSLYPTLDPGPSVFLVDNFTP